MEVAKMRNIKFLKEPGYIFDLFFLFVLNFNKEYCLSNYINYDKSSEDTNYFKNLLNDFPPIYDELILFFHLMDNKKCFMTTYYFDPYHKDFVSGKYNISVVQEALNDYEQVTENLIRFYFKDIDDETLQKCKTSLPLINQLIKNSAYNSDIKSALYSFFIEPAPILRRLSYELMEKDFNLNQKYNNNPKYAELQEKFDFKFVSEGFRENKNATVCLDDFDYLYVSFCLFNKNVIKNIFFDNITEVILGADYVDLIKYLSTQQRRPELESFGNAISETNRINVLNYILNMEEITIKDLEQEFGFTGTNAYYHLSLMIKAGLLKTRNRGRTVLYSINKDYFQRLCSALSKYSK